MAAGERDGCGRRHGEYEPGRPGVGERGERRADADACRGGCERRGAGGRAGPSHAGQHGGWGPVGGHRGYGGGHGCGGAGSVGSGDECAWRGRAGAGDGLLGGRGHAAGGADVQGFGGEATRWMRGRTR